jgi:hypothetical protein
MSKISSYPVSPYDSEAIVIGTVPDSLETKNYRLGDIPGSGGSFKSGKRGSFYSTENQPNNNLGIYSSEPVTLNVTDEDITDGFVIEPDDLGKMCRVKALQDGVYNFQFSIQFVNNTNSESYILLWLKKNGIDVDYSNSQITLKNGGVIAAWNFFVQLNENEYIELHWVGSTGNIDILSSTSIFGHPAIPSVIATINQI